MNKINLAFKISYIVGLVLFFSGLILTGVYIFSVTSHKYWVIINSDPILVAGGLLLIFKFLRDVYIAKTKPKKVG